MLVFISLVPAPSPHPLPILISSFIASRLRAGKDNSPKYKVLVMFADSSYHVNQGGAARIHIWIHTFILHVSITRSRTPASHSGSSCANRIMRIVTSTYVSITYSCTWVGHLTCMRAFFDITYFITDVLPLSYRPGEVHFDIIKKIEITFITFVYI